MILVLLVLERVRMILVSLRITKYFQSSMPRPMPNRS